MESPEFVGAGSGGFAEQADLSAGRTAPVASTGNIEADWCEEDRGTSRKRGAAPRAHKR